MIAKHLRVQVSARTTRFPCTSAAIIVKVTMDWDFEFADVQLGDLVRRGNTGDVHLGRYRGDPVLVTRSGHQKIAPTSTVLILPYAGIARYRWCGGIGPPGYEWALVEAMPPGRPARTGTAIAPLGAAIAEVLARVHRDERLIEGIQPELIYTTDDGVLTEIVPRGPGFLAGAHYSGAGWSAYPVPYVGHECLVLGKEAGPPNDVFALCASLFVLATGRHPFGALDDLQEIMNRVLASAPDTLPGPVGEVIARGLVNDPAARPTAEQLVGMFVDC
jgi:hypothetical protein